MITEFEYQLIKPDPSISDVVESFWFLHNHSNSAKELVILPDGRIDLFLSKSATTPFHMMLSGLETQADHVTFPAKTRMFAISFKLLATEYILQNTVSQLLNKTTDLPSNFWNFCENDLHHFDSFREKATKKILSLLPNVIDHRKQKLFNLVYSSNGEMTVKELSDQVFWSSRQINRYFNQQFGLSLKAYNNILRFRASFEHIKEGKLFPQQNFTDQSHFIKEIKKLSGVSPKELNKNKNDRFIQFSTLTSK